MADNYQISKFMRGCRLRDMLAAVAEWQHSTGTDRRYWRRVAGALIAEFRHRHLIPERAAFEAAVARSKYKEAA